MRSIVARRVSSIALAALLLAACRGAVDDTLTSHAFPGFEVPLPAWSVQKDDATWNTGEYMAQEGRNIAVVRWTPAGEALTDDDLRSILALFGQIRIEDAVTPVTVAGHAGSVIGFSVSGISGNMGAWFCPDRQREHIVFVTGDKGFVQRILGGTRCHTAPAPPDALTAGRFPSFEPPSGFTSQPADPGVKVWSAEDGVLVAASAQVGDLTAKTRLVDSNRFIDLLAGMMSLRDLSERTSSRIDDRDGRSRVVMHTRAKMEELPVDLTLMIWFCADQDRSFVTLFLQTEVNAEKARQHLLRFECPSP